jgi:hypothetical protein
MVFDPQVDVRRLNAIGDPLLYRIGLAGLFSHYGIDRVRRALIEEAARAGTISIASATNWMRAEPPRRRAS